MNIEEYNQLYNYISDPTKPHVPKNVRERAKQFEIFDERLFRKHDGKLLLVVQSTEVDNLLYLSHEHPLGGHFGIEKMAQKLLKHHWWPHLGKSIAHYVKS